MTELSEQNRALLSAFGVDAPQTVSEFRMMRETMGALLDAARAEGAEPPPSYDGSKSLGEGEEFLEFKEALSDLRSLRHEYECLNGGGPGWSTRNAAAWTKVDELFASEDEAAWVRQQEDAHG